MPAYEYQCDGCETHFEQRQKMSEPALETCPQCGGRVKRLISGGAGAITRSGSSGSQYAPPQCGMGAGACCGGPCMGEESPCAH
jgi:putative FmdB family regulatory protein